METSRAFFSERPEAVKPPLPFERGLAKEYAITHLDGSRPDAWRYLVEVGDAGRPADAAGYR